MICGIDFCGPMSAAEAKAMGRGSWVYVVYDGSGLRYVGQSTNLATRMTSHEQCGPGATIFVASVPYVDRLATERRLINELRPRFNKGAGRPQKPQGQALSASLKIKMKPADRDLIDRAAGGEPTVWAREALLRLARRILGKEGSGS